MEFIRPIPTWLDMPPEAATLFKAFRSEKAGRQLLIEQNAFIEQILPKGVIRQLSSEEMDSYRAPFQNPMDREPIFRFPNDLPIAGAPADVWAAAVAWHEWLLTTETPKLFFWAVPGVLIPPPLAAWYAAQLKSCRTIALGAGAHFLQEDHPDRIGREIATWLSSD